MAPVLIDLESGSVLRDVMPWLDTLVAGGPHTLDSQPGTGSGVGSGGLRAVALDSVLEAVALDNSKVRDNLAQMNPESSMGYT